MHGLSLKRGRRSQDLQLTRKQTRWYERGGKGKQRWRPAASELMTPKPYLGLRNRVGYLDSANPCARLTTMARSILKRADLRSLLEIQPANFQALALGMRLLAEIGQRPIPQNLPEAQRR